MPRKRVAEVCINQNLRVAGVEELILQPHNIPKMEKGKMPVHFPLSVFYKSRLFNQALRHQEKPFVELLFSQIDAFSSYLFSAFRVIYVS